MNEKTVDQGKIKEAYELGRREIIDIALTAIASEEELPGYMLDELWIAEVNNRNRTKTAMRSTVRLTKRDITERLQAALKKLGVTEGGVCAK